jgi:hypothetical protein
MKEFFIPGCGNIVFINPIKAHEAMKQYYAGQIVQVSAEDVEFRAYDVPPLPDTTMPDGFPECCDGHREMYQNLKEEFNRFPNCCDHHKRMNGARWFDKSNYLYIPMKVMNSFGNTISAIKQYGNAPDWHKRIKDYIDVVIRSFGQFPLNYGPPLGASQYVSIIRNNLPLIDELSSEKHLAIEAMLNDHFRSGKKNAGSDLDLLLNIYNEWLRIFPFEIPYLQPLKAHLESTLPVLKKALDTNMYTGQTAYSLKSKAELLNFIKKATLIIISDLNAGKLHEKGELTDLKTTALKLLTAKRRLEIEELQLTSKSDQNSYIKLLKKWLKGEKEFITELRLTLGDETHDELFRRSLCDVLQNFQRNDVNEPSLMNIRNNGPNKESMIRYAVKNFLSARFPDATLVAEEEKGTGFMDLKLYHTSFSHKVIEFKGWWNYDKKDIAFQISSYLTDFENEGYIFMINHLKSKDVTPDYKILLQSSHMNYIADSWSEHSNKSNGFTYFSSRHQFSGREKVIFHYLFNVYF